jgi:predicted DNA-binding protein (MmcQ/YjbR family)
MARKAARKRAKTAGAKRGSKNVLKDYCRSLPGTTEDVKWEDDLVFSVGGKMYAAFDLEDEYAFGFKSEEEEFMGLIQIEGIIPAPYLAKHFWVKVNRKGALSDSEWKRLLKKAHGLVLAGLSGKKQREIMGGSAGKS